MANNLSFEAQIQQLDTAGLVQLWESIKSKQTLPQWPPGKAFEYLVVRAFQLEGADICWPYAVTSKWTSGQTEQIDGLVRVDNRAFLLEAKDHDASVDIAVVTKLRFRLERRPPDTMGIILTRGSISTATDLLTSFAVPMNVLFFTGSDIDVALPQQKMIEGLRQKVARAQQYGFPHYSLGNTP